MRINKKVEAAIAYQFEDSLDCLPALDKVPFHIKREAACEAARITFVYLTERKYSREQVQR